MVTRGPVGLLMAFLAVLSACTSDLSPVQPVLDAASIRIADSEPHDVRIEAPPDATVLITVSGKDVDIKASVLNSALSTTVYTDAPNRRMGIETLLVEPPHDGVIVVVDNFYSSATGGQDLLSSRADNTSRSTNNQITKAVEGVGATWVRQIGRASCRERV